MARARNIKPSFFVDSDLGELSAETRLLFAGLWCLADREGRLHDKPKEIKIQILPWDKVDINKLLDSLSPKFITRYEVDGKRCIKINNFLKHQHPHPTEKSSDIPDSCPLTVKEPLNNSYNPSDSLNTDSLNTDSLIPHPCTPDGGGEDDEEKNKKSNCPAKEIVKLYNETLPMMPQCKGTDTVIKQIRDRWKQDRARQSIDWWKDFFVRVSKSEFLTTTSANGWKCDLTWLTCKSNMDKVIEGRYQGRDSPSREPPKKPTFQDKDYATKDYSDSEDLGYFKGLYENLKNNSDDKTEAGNGILS